MCYQVENPNEFLPVATEFLYPGCMILIDWVTCCVIEKISISYDRFYITTPCASYILDPHASYDRKRKTLLYSRALYINGFSDGI